MLNANEWRRRAAVGRESEATHQQRRALIGASVLVAIVAVFLACHLPRAATNLTEVAVPFFLAKDFEDCKQSGQRDLDQCVLENKEAYQW